MFEEFKKFAMRGNVVDMAVGIIIGAAFGKIVTSFVNDVLMPPIGLLIGGVNFKSLFIALGQQQFQSIEAAKEAGVPVIAYGSFLQTVFDFILVAFAIFMVVKAMNNLKKKEQEKPAEPAKPSPEVQLLTEIRDSLKK
ncbi:MAG: large-conductance mechanosensitive channel protein MscL [Deltaproteobacteria bacterium]|nr:large-conductance mechanosensitive channel protein MscL [Deltaproteobacteria bacterium]